VVLKNHFETDQHYFFILEFVSGGEVFLKILELTYFSEDLARHIILQVAQGIQYLHETVGVVHRYDAVLHSLPPRYYFAIPST
jgi:serine/threonine protein kinase